VEGQKVINESALLESKALRSSVLGRTDVLDRVKALSLLPDGMHVTTAMVATYFGVTVEVIRQVKARHQDELTGNGMVTLQGEALAKFKRDVLSRYPGAYPQPRSSLTLYSRRAVLNIGMLLRDSEVARQVRVYLLDTEYLARTQPVENCTGTGPASLDDHIDQRIAHILGKTVVPMFNALIESSSEHRRELIALREDIENVERRICWHHHRISALEGEEPRNGISASIRKMTWLAFERHVADLLRRDGCTEVVVRRANSDRGIDVTARTADGRTVAVQCKRYSDRQYVSSADMQKFAGAAHTVEPADIALYVATCTFTHEAQAIARLSGIVLVDRYELEAWTSGVRLRTLR
jgi:restriction system protein